MRNLSSIQHLYVNLLVRCGDIKMITKLGKYLRKFRVDSDMNLGNMAKAVGISPAFLSSIETGKRDIKEPVINGLANVMKLSGNKVEEFTLLALASNKEVKVNLENQSEKTAETVTFLARHIADLEPSTLDGIAQLVSKDVQGRA